MAIHKKLLEFQKLGISIKKTKKNPHFKSDYADLNEVLDKVKAPLNKLNVVIIQQPDMIQTHSGWEYGLRTTLYDIEDDTSVSGFLPYVEATTAQKLGSSNTYNRRYALVTMLGLEDNDDDGNKASERKQAVADDAPPETEEELEVADINFD